MGKGGSHTLRSVRFFHVPPSFWAAASTEMRNILQINELRIVSTMENAVTSDNTGTRVRILRNPNCVLHLLSLGAIIQLPVHNRCSPVSRWLLRGGPFNWWAGQSKEKVAGGSKEREKMKMCKVLAGAALFAAVSGSVNAHANMLVNGGLEVTSDQLAADASLMYSDGLIHASRPAHSTAPSPAGRSAAPASMSSPTTTGRAHRGPTAST